MKNKKNIRVVSMATLALALAFSGAAFAQTETVLHTFAGGPDGSQGGGFYNATGSDSGNLIFDSAGNLYGTAFQGGASNVNCDNGTCGVVYELSPNGSGGWTQTTLHEFSGNGDGYWPRSGVVMDGAGNLYGTTEWGGPNQQLCLQNGCGVVYELSPTGGGTWHLSVLHAFADGADGANPYANLTLDSAGNLYGTTSQGGRSPNCLDGCGVVFKLSHNSTGGWTETVLHRFSSADGYLPFAGVVFDATGNLYGSTTRGGPAGYGEVFRLSPTSSGAWTFTILHAFEGNRDGAYPAGNLVLDNRGNIFGATSNGGVHACGGDIGCGLIFEILPNSGGGYTKANIYTVPSSGSTVPVGSPILDSAGNLYEAVSGGSTISGNVIELSPGGSGSWTESAVFNFSGTADGAYPDGGVILDSSGNFYGTTSGGGGGSCNCGVVYEIVR